jgi:hypothetical protein
MFIYSGTKRKEKPIGFASDICPMCRDIKVVQVYKVSMAGHLYGVSLSEGETAGHYKSCEDCNSVQYIDITQYQTLSESRLTVEELIPRTFPSINEVYREEISFYEKIRNTPSSLSQDERNLIIRDLFNYLAHPIEELYSKDTSFDKKSGMGCFVTLLLMFLLFVIAGVSNIEEGNLKTILGSLLILIPVIGGGITFYYLATTHSRHIKNVLIPQIAKSLKSIRPTKDELDSVLNEFKSLKMKIGKKLKSKEIIDSISLLQIKK